MPLHPVRPSPPRRLPFAAVILLCWFPAGVFGSEDARNELRRIADRTPAAVADDALRMEARLFEARTAVRQASPESKALKVDFQRRFAAALDDTAREQLLAEYVAVKRTLAAQEALLQPKPARPTGGK